MWKRHSPSQIIMYKLLVIVGAVAALSTAAKFPNDVKRCKRTEPDFNKCLQAAVQDTVSKLVKENRDLGLSSLEPLEIPSVVVGAGNGPVNLVQNYKNVKLHGYSRGNITNFELDFATKTMRMEVFFEKLVWKADYNVNGKILVLPVFGEGKCTLTLNRLHATQTFHLGTLEKKGKQHFKVEKSVIKLRPEGVGYDFENLFNGDKALGDNINTVLNENWLEIFDDVKSGYQATIEKVNGQLMGNVFKKFSISDLFE